MNNDYLLDTGVANLVTWADPATLARLQSQGRSIYLPDIVFGELYFGAFRYAYLHQSTKFLDAYDRLRQEYQDSIILCDLETAHIYGANYAELTAKGQIIQQNDCWIAALARQHGFIVATTDQDLLRVTGIVVEVW